MRCVALRLEGAGKSFIKTLTCTKSNEKITHLALRAFDLLVEVKTLLGCRLNIMHRFCD